MDSANRTIERAGPGWYTDPAGRFDGRYWDGTDWDSRVAKYGIVFRDPLTKNLAAGWKRAAVRDRKPNP